VLGYRGDVQIRETRFSEHGAAGNSEAVVCVYCWQSTELGDVFHHAGELIVAKNRIAVPMLF
jgi:hypothetical protein